MNSQSQKVCPKCTNHHLQPLSLHFSNEGTCTAKTSVIRITDKVISFQDGTFICQRCFKIFENQNTWAYHRKRISSVCPGFNSLPIIQVTPSRNAANFQSNQANTELTNSAIVTKETPQKLTFTDNITNSFAKPSDAPNRTFYNTSLFGSSLKVEQKVIVTKELDKNEQTSLLFLDIFASRCKIHLIEWVTKNFKIKRIFLQHFFERFTDKLIKRLEEEIKAPTFSDLGHHLKFDWRKIFDDPTDIFDQEEIIRKVQNLPPSTKAKVLKCLNTIYEQDYNNIFPKFTINYKPLEHRSFAPLRSIDFFDILEQLFRTKQQALVHIAIDLLLIFQSGQRSASDRENIQQGIQDLLQQRKSQPGLCQFEMKISKIAHRTNKKSKFMISQQMCQLLQGFAWKSFYKKGKIYQRMYRVFGFPAYSIKKCLFSQISLRGAQYLKPNIQKLADHKQKQTAENYARAGEDAKIKILKDSLKVPNLTIQPISRQQLHSSLAKYPPFQKYLQVNKNWLHNLKRKLGSHYNKDQINFYNWIASDFIQNPVPGNIHNYSEKAQNIIQKMQDESQSVISKDQKEIVEIFEQPYQFSSGKFKFADAYLSGEIQYCIICMASGQNAEKSLLQGMYCKFCFAHYHSQCVPKFCNCLLRKSDPNNGIRYQNTQKQQKCNIQIKMPKVYFRKNDQNLDQIKFLLNARRFYYTATAVYLNDANFQPASLNIRSYKLIKLDLPGFQEYQNQEYFPPIQLRRSGNFTTSGSGFGLFASQQITKNCFIGEYAADILTDQIAIMIRRPDAVMTLIPGDRPYNNVVIGPVKHCGYVCLINGCSEQQANCKIITAEVNGFIRLILYTTKPIKKGTQLLYNYSSTSMYSKDSLQSYKKDKECKNRNIILSNQVKTSLKRCGLKNQGDTCYMNSVFQLLRLTIYANFNESTDPISRLFSNIMSQMGQNSIYSPLQQVLAISTLSQQKFTINRQNDAHQFLIFLLSHLGESVEHQVRGSSSGSIQCSQCSFISPTRDHFYVLNVDLSNATTQTIFQIRTQQIDYKCERCDKQVKATKRQQICEFPDLLLICLKRFNNDCDKITTLVDNFCIERQRPEYKLVALISHIGDSIETGHYVTHQIVDKQTIITYDDSLVIQKKYKDQEAYILGYSKT